jgi:hypothetical protein
MLVTRMTHSSASARRAPNVLSACADLVDFNCDVAQLLEGLEDMLRIKGHDRETTRPAMPRDETVVEQVCLSRRAFDLTPKHGGLLDLRVSITTCAGNHWPRSYLGMCVLDHVPCSAPSS